MENTLVIYDNNGKIFTQITGSFLSPEGLQHLITQIPKGKIIVGVDVENAEAIFQDIPKTDIERLEEILDEHEMSMVEIVNMITGGE